MAELKFCPNCGHPVEPGDKYCANCGYHLEEAITRREITETPGEEYVIGGISSGDLRRGLLAGYSLYVTNMRVVGVKSKKAALLDFVKSGGLGAIPATVAEIKKDPNREKLLRELEKAKKDFELYKDNIVSIEIKKPGFIKAGHIIFRTRSGEEVKIQLLSSLGDREYKYLVELLKHFKPESLLLA
ncbi:zinc ribbon domain-containing protein [Palaeococcus ferrophilus]|uniref:zinc ribbon domain-containing protein n=1 Tax=Palaeococcus ferrophilus TaxID=83868 RepID=UPI00064FBD34|nr:zinc ribbon domain-containing protein [Palaeococcus ferrophilus]